VDRNALPAPEYGARGYEAPQGEAEVALAQIWSEVLGIEQVSRTDNFFELGGDSILSLQIVARARQAGWQVSARQLFERQTVALLAGVAQRAKVLETRRRFDPEPADRRACAAGRLASERAATI